MKTAQDIMTKRDKVLVFSPDDDLVVVIEKLAAQHFSGAPVIRDGKVVGVISESDLIGLEGKTGREVRSLKVQEIMTKSVVSVKPTADLAEVAKVLSSRKINRAIVIDQQGQLLGLIARDDLMRAAVSEL